MPAPTPTPELTEEDWIQRQKEEQWAREHEQRQSQENPWFASQRAQEGPYEGSYDPMYDPRQYEQQQYDEQQYEQYEDQRQQQQEQRQQAPHRRALGPQPPVELEPEAEPEPEPEPEELPGPTLPEGMSRDEAYFHAFRRYVSERKDMPNARQLAVYLQDLYGVTGRTGGPLSESSMRNYMKGYPRRYQEELDAQDSEHIA